MIWAQVHVLEWEFDTRNWKVNSSYKTVGCMARPTQVSKVPTPFFFFFTKLHSHLLQVLTASGIGITTAMGVMGRIVSWFFSVQKFSIWSTRCPYDLWCNIDNKTGSYNHFFKSALVSSFIFKSVALLGSIQYIMNKYKECFMFELD